jgi:fatty-acyl-CoA synthase
MSLTAEATSVFSAVRRAGLLDPLSLAALTSSTAVWGPSIAAAYGAAAVRYPNRIAIVDDHGRLTYSRLDRRTARLAAALRKEGLRRGDAIGVLCRNHRGFVEANLAAAKLGAKPILLNTGLPANQLAEVITRESISVVLADQDLADRVTAHRVTMDRADNATEDVSVFVCDPGADREWSFPELSSRLPLLQMPRPFDSNTPIILTSGTTGAPKGTRRSTDPKASVGLLGFVEAVPYRRGDVTVLPAPLFHAWGFSQMVLSATLAGTIVIREHFDPQNVLNDVEVHGATVLAAVPVMLHRILESDDQTAERDLTSLRVVATSGSALPGDLAIQWMDRFGDTLYNLYGSTEVGQVSVAGPTDLRADPNTAGRPLRGITVRILDDDDNEVPTGTTGQVMIESAARFDGYTDGGGKRMVGALMSSGDRGHLDQDGRLFISGRSDDMIISGGENIFPSNIERQLLSHESISAAAVVGVSDADLGQKVRAVIVRSADGTTATDASVTKSIKAHLKGGLASHEVPREYVYVSELPRNTTGKVLRTKLTGPKRSIPHRTTSPATRQKNGDPS